MSTAGHNSMLKHYIIYTKAEALANIFSWFSQTGANFKSGLPFHFKLAAQFITYKTLQVQSEFECHLNPLLIHHFSH